MTQDYIQTDFLIIGSGIAGLRAALELSKNNQKVALVTKSYLHDSNTYYAQGGIAAVDPERIKKGEDSFDLHYEDTMKAGKGLCNSEVVKNFTEKAHETIDFLIEKGVDFSKTEGKYPYVLHQEGGHSRERIYCVGDYTGKSIEEALVEAVKNDPNIDIYEFHSAIDLIKENNTCQGAYILDRNNKTVKTFDSAKTFIATGGAGRVFRYTSNPDNATGDGIAMAHRAGIKIENMEFYQFHPTVLYEDSADLELQDNDNNQIGRRFLITEALRGEKMGGILTLKKDSIDDFVLNYSPDGSHSTRDLVARAIDTEIKKKGLKHVWLNVTPKVTGKSAEYIRESFPQIYEFCLSKGTDITKDPIPVVPAAHYSCGGISVNMNGETSMDNLYAIGEASCTGLMGANRLASNSLSEGAMYGKLAVEHALLTYKNEERKPLEKWNYGTVKREHDTATMNQFWDLTRTTMTNLCGIDRNEERLRLAVGITEALSKSAHDIYWDCHPTNEIIELRNLTQVANLIATAALKREESRGCHYRSDFPDMKV